jgi:hypothetical protein
MNRTFSRAGSYPAIQAIALGLVADGLDDDLVPVVAQDVAHADRVVLTEVVVLIDDRELRVLHVRQYVLGVDLRLGAVARLEAHRPRILLNVGPFAGAGADEQVRYLLAVQVLRDCRIARRAETPPRSLTIFGAADHAIGRGRTAVRHGFADLHGLFGGGAGTRQPGRRKRNTGRHRSPATDHALFS